MKGNYRKQAIFTFSYDFLNEVVGNISCPIVDMLGGFLRLAEV